MVTFLEISCQTNEIGIIFIVFDTVLDDKLDIGINLIDSQVLLVVNFPLYGPQIHRLFNDLEVIWNVVSLNINRFSKRQGNNVLLET